MVRVSELVGARADRSNPGMRIGVLPELRAAPNEHAKAASLYEEVTEGIREVGEGIRKGGRVLAGAFVRQLRHLAGTPETIAALLPTAFSAYDPVSFLDRHSANVVILALATAQALGIGEESLLCIGFAAAAHDLGMYLLPTELVYKRGALTRDEAQALRRHPGAGLALIRSTKHNSERVAQAVYQEHEREDGKGYPEGLDGSRISLEAKIIGVVDTFEALIHNRPHRPGLPPFAVIRQLAGRDRAGFCPKVLRSFLTQVTAFPPTTRVRLNDGRLGEVVRVKPESPLRPVVRIDGPEARGQDLLDLARAPLLSIAAVLDGQTCAA